MTASPAEMVVGSRGRLHADLWPTDAYDRASLPERVLLFGTGMLLRALPVALIDAANRAGTFGGRVVVVQSTPNGLAAALNAQNGLFTLVERGTERGAPVERVRVVGAVSRALVADTDWPAVRELAASAALRVIVSNVTEAGFRLDEGADTGVTHPALATGAPASFPAKLVDLLHTRFRRTPNAPTLFVIPTELVDDNGAALGAMVDRLAARTDDADAFRTWLASRVRFCSSLVDRITTGTPEPAAHAAIEARLGYEDALLTVAEPYALWAVEGEPDALRDALAVDGATGDPSGAPSPAEAPVVFARDIRRYRERKIRLLNGAHTALAPLARLAGVTTVREAVAHPALGAYLRQILFDEIVPSTDLPVDEAHAFAESVLDRFANPWLDHAWSVIATNQTMKTRLRVVPSIVGYAAKRGAVPQGLALAIAATLRHARCTLTSERTGRGSSRGGDYDVSDVELARVVGHWQGAGDVVVGEPAPAAVLDRVAASALADGALWGHPLAELPGMLASTSRWLHMLERDGVEAALAAAAEHPAGAS